MPVNSTRKTRWEEQALSKYLLDPSTGEPAGSVTTPLRGRLPGHDFLGGTSFTLDGSLTKWLAPSPGTTVITIAAQGGEVYYEINGVTASATSPGYVADGTVQRIGPVCNMSSMWVFSATADTFVHVNYYRETNSALAGVWPEPDYWQRVLRLNPIASWPMWETSGTVAHCLVNPAQNGVYTGVTLANDNTGPFGTPAPWFDGATSYNNVQTAALAAALNGTTGSVFIWVRVNAAAVWADGVARMASRLAVDANNFSYLRKAAAANVVEMRFRGGGVGNAVSEASALTTWFCIGTTWNAATSTSYYNAVPEIAQARGAWAGNIAVSVIGASTIAPLNVWHGWLGPCTIWDRELSQAEVTAVSLA